MKISSKSILSPGRTGVRNHPTSLTTSHSRRLRTSGSIRGGASPATFTTTAKKRGNFENPEPSSPKVTCIGQVRVRSRRKQAKRLRNLSRRRTAGEGSFGKLDHPLNGFPSKRHKHKESLNLGSKSSQNGQQNQNQECSPAQKKWAHFPVTICDSLKAFGSEFSCLFPCRGKEEKTVVAQGGDRQGSCGEEFARWLVAVQDGDEEEQEEESVRKSRRHVFEDLQIIDDRIEGHKDEGRVSACVPPKNALLLMRGRSEPIKIETFTNRSWEPSVERTDEGDEIVENEDLIEEDLEMPQENLELGQKQVMILDQDQENAQQDEANQEQEHVQQDEVGQDQEQDNVVQHCEVGENQVVILDQENVQQDEANKYQENDILQQDEDDHDQEHEIMQLYEVGEGQEHNPTEELEESYYLVSLFEEIVNQDFEIQENDETHEEEEVVNEAEDHKNGVLDKESEEVLPECLLMMMYEPKLSMEVSKETWVCRTDFIQRQSRIPPAPATVPAKPDGGDESSVNATATVNEVSKVAGGGFPTALLQPARSSCTLPAGPSMAMVVEQKFAKAVGYEPFVLTRCKSEPVKTASSKLQPESCVLENRKLERLSRVAFSVGAAGLGF